MEFIKQLFCKENTCDTCDNCSICLEKMTKVNISINECGHKFHTKCLLQSNRHLQFCPLCRRNLVEDANNSYTIQLSQFHMLCSGYYNE